MLTPKIFVPPNYPKNNIQIKFGFFQYILQMIHYRKNVESLGIFHFSSLHDTFINFHK